MDASENLSVVANLPVELPLMLVQSWTIAVSFSRWLLYMRFGCLLVLASCAGWVFVFGTGLAGVSGWWGDWLWPWPILLYLTWVLASVRAPLLPAAPRIALTANGELGADIICHSLRTPWLIALCLRPQSQIDSSGDDDHIQWVWVCRDQLSAADWTRLNRVCQSVLTRSPGIP